MYKNVLNGLMFNLSWLAITCTHDDLLAASVVCVHLALHFVCWKGGWREAILVAMVSLLGLAFDHLLFAAGILVQGSGTLAPPIWLTCLWPVFATTLMHLFLFLQTRPLTAAVIGGRRRRSQLHCWHPAKRYRLHQRSPGSVKHRADLGAADAGAAYCGGAPGKIQPSEAVQFVTNRSQTNRATSLLH